LEPVEQIDSGWIGGRNPGRGETYKYESSEEQKADGG
jgi:hypothetical protein